MLSKFIVTSYATLLEVALWLILLVSIVVGWNLGGFWGVLGGLIIWFIVAVTFFGAFLVLSDIRQSVRAIEKGSKPQE